jgi:hypothetical protein
MIVPPELRYDPVLDLSGCSHTALCNVIFFLLIRRINDRYFEGIQKLQQNHIAAITELGRIQDEARAKFVATIDRRLGLEKPQEKEKPS